MKKFLYILVLLGATTLCYASEPTPYYTNSKMGLYAYYNCINNTVTQTEDFIHEMNQFKHRTIMYYCFKNKPQENIKENEKYKIMQELQDKNPAIRILYNVYPTENGTEFAMYMNLFSPSNGKPLKAYEKGVSTNYFWREGTLDNVDMYNWIQKQK